MFLSTAKDAEESPQKSNFLTEVFNEDLDSNRECNYVKKFEEESDKLDNKMKVDNNRLLTLDLQTIEEDVRKNLDFDLTFSKADNLK